MVSLKLQDILSDLRHGLDKRDFSEIPPRHSAHPEEIVRFEKRASKYRIEVGLEEEHYDEECTDLKAFYVGFDYNTLPNLAIEDGEKIAPGKEIVTEAFKSQPISIHSTLAFPNSCPRNNRFRAVYELNFPENQDAKKITGILADFIKYVCDNIESKGSSSNT